MWKTFEEARRAAPEGYSVFGVVADWETDTVPSSSGDWHDLLVSADLVILASGPVPTAEVPPDEIVREATLTPPCQ